MPKEPINRTYVSEADQFIMDFDKRPEAHSKNRQAEVHKYHRVHFLRDNEVVEDDDEMWEEF